LPVKNQEVTYDQRTLCDLTVATIRSIVHLGIQNAAAGKIADHRRRPAGEGDSRVDEIMKRGR